MFSQYTWGDFFKVMGSATVVYYAVVGWVFYRGRIRRFLSSMSPGKEASKLPLEAEVEDDDSDMYETVPYPGPDTSTAATTKPVKAVIEVPKEAQATEEVKPIQSEATASAPVHNISEEPVQEPQVSQKPDFELPEVPAVNDILPNDDLLGLSGINMPQSEQPLQDIVDAANGLEKQADGSIAVTDPANRDAALLSEVIKGQAKISLADIIAKR